MRLVSSAKIIVSLAVLVTCSTVLSAQTPAAAPKTASEFYLEYRTAFAKAKKIDDLFPYMTAEHRKQAEATPAGERAQMFEMMKSFDTTKNIKVVKEERTPTGATLSVEGVGDGNKKQTGTVKIVREGGAMKIGEESWKGSM